MKSLTRKKTTKTLLMLADPFGRQLALIPSILARFSVVILWALILLLSWVPQALGAEEEDDVMELSLQELLNLQVTSVSRSAEKRTEAAAAIFVLTQEDIKSSGATTIPDALRTVPGLNVAQIDASKWSVTSRGFAERFANKLLVMIDGRTIYTPFFAGVYWESTEVMLANIERIEVIRGPGGALWGANAVNGVINIVTKHATDTQGGLLSLRTGTEEQAYTALRYGGKVADLGHYRVYGEFAARDEGGSFFANNQGVSGGSANDDWNNLQGGFRMDLNLSNEDTLLIHANASKLRAGATHDLAFPVAPESRRIDSTTDGEAFNFMTRWNRELSDTSQLQLQLYYSYYHMDDMAIEEQRHNIDLDFQYSLQVDSKHEIVWGLGHRLTSDEFGNTAFESLDPDSRTDHLFSAFAQDRIALTDTLKLTIGTKLEYNNYTNFEIQPSARIAWTPNDNHTLWGAVSRAVRTPTRAERDFTLNYLGQPGNNLIVVYGNKDFKSEDLIAIETGYRVNLSDKLAIDLATFYNMYDNLRFAEAGTPFFDPDPAPGHTVLPFTLQNSAEATTFGFELSADYQAKPWWFARASYSFIEVHVKNAQSGSHEEGDVPEQTFTLENRFQLPRNLEFDSTLRYVDQLADIGIGDYLELDARLAWRPRDDLELALIGRNLFNNQHKEYAPAIIFNVPTEVQRSIYGKVTWRF